MKSTNRKPLPSYTVTATIIPRTETGAHSSDTHEKTVTVQAKTRRAAMSEARTAFAALSKDDSLPYGFALTFREVTRKGDLRPYLRLSPGSSARGADMGRISTVPIGSGPIKMHLLRVRLDSGGYDAGGAYWGLGEPMYRAVSASEVPTAYGPRTAPISTGRVERVQRFTRAESRAEAKALIQEAIPGATFFR